MGKLTEDPSLRDKYHVFQDRTDAGRLLSQRLAPYKKTTEGIVLGIPSGGIPVAIEIANSLGLPLDFLIIEKIEFPYAADISCGAIGPDGDTILNDGLLHQLGITESEIQAQIKKAAELIFRKDHLFREGRQEPFLKDKIAIIADDGVSFGYTMSVAVKYVKSREPQKIVVAVPTASKDTAEFLLPEVDELFCLNIRSGPTFAIRDAYKKWPKLPHQEVLTLIKQNLDKSGL